MGACHRLRRLAATRTSWSGLESIPTRRIMTVKDFARYMAYSPACTDEFWRRRPVESEWT